MRLAAVIVRSACHEQAVLRRRREVSRGRVRVVVGVIGLERVDAGRGEPGDPLVAPDEPRMGDRREASGVVDRAMTSSGDAPARGTNAGRPRDRNRSKASAVVGTWPPATSARAIHGRPTALVGSSIPGWTIASASRSMPIEAEAMDHRADAVDADAGAARPEMPRAAASARR